MKSLSSKKIYTLVKTFLKALLFDRKIKIIALTLWVVCVIGYGYIFGFLANPFLTTSNNKKVNTQKEKVIPSSSQVIKIAKVEEERIEPSHQTQVYINLAAIYWGKPHDLIDMGINRYCINLQDRNHPKNLNAESALDDVRLNLRQQLKAFAKAKGFKIVFKRKNINIPDVTQDFIQFMDRFDSSLNSKSETLSHSNPELILASHVSPSLSSLPSGQSLAEQYYAQNQEQE